MVPSKIGGIAGGGTPTTTAMQHLLLHFVTATVRTHNQNQGHAWQDLGAQARSPDVQRSGKDKHHMVREAKRQPNNRQASGLVPGWLPRGMLKAPHVPYTASHN
jgi:hypothetical protein